MNPEICPECDEPKPDAGELCPACEDAKMAGLFDRHPPGAPTPQAGAPSHGNTTR